MSTHELKTIEPHFSNVLTGSKKFEIRLNDRDFQIGDYLLLKEYPCVGELSLTIKTQITYILTHEDFPQGLQPGYVILSMTPAVLQDTP